MPRSIAHAGHDVLTTGSRLLQNALLCNALFSTICGLSLLIYSTNLNAFLGSSAYIQSEVLMGLGGMLIFFAASLFITSMRVDIHQGLAALAVVLDAGWVLGSAALLALPLTELTILGELLIAGIAVIVGGFAIAQWVGLNHLKQPA